MNRHATTAVAGLFAAGALAVPVADANPKPPTLEELANEINSIPDPSTVPGGPQTVVDDPADAPALGEPPDPESGDDVADVATVVPTVVATPVATEVPTVVAEAATPEPTATPVATATPEITPGAVQSAEPTPAVTVAPEPTAAQPESGAATTIKRHVKNVRHRPHRASAKRGRAATQPTHYATPAQPQARRPVARVRVRQPVRVVAARTRHGRHALGRGMYLIRPGDTLSGIAARYGLSWPRLAAINGLTNPDVIYAGDTLLLY